jgi:hypothetical protein
MSITLLRGDDQKAHFTVYTTPSKTDRMSLVNVEQVWFTIKDTTVQHELTDANVAVQKLMTNGGIVITDANEGLLDVVINKNDLNFATKRRKYSYDLQLKFTGSQVRTAIIDACIIQFDVTRSNA